MTKAVWSIEFAAYEASMFGARVPFKQDLRPLHAVMFSWWVPFTRRRRAWYLIIEPPV